MPRLKRLSGAEVIQILGEFGFQVHSQKGSHVKLRCFGVDKNEKKIEKEVVNLE